MDSDTALWATTVATILLAIITTFYAWSAYGLVKVTRSANAINFRANFGAFLVPFIERAQLATGQGDALIIRILNVGRGPAIDVRVHLLLPKGQQIGKPAVIPLLETETKIRMLIPNDEVLGLQGKGSEGDWTYDVVVCECSYRDATSGQTYVDRSMALRDRSQEIQAESVT